MTSIEVGTDIQGRLGITMLHWNISLWEHCQLSGDFFLPNIY